nr:transposase, MuDR, MULE transposase domain protein [Tanacetum cinerariifolium]
MRPLIIIDAAHLKGTYLGTNIVVVGMDSNNQIIPIATGVAQSDTNESWTWFLSKLKDCIREVSNLTIISDRHYAITHACKNEFPNSFHGYCCRHLMMNCNMKSDKLNGLYWKTYKAYTILKFEKLIALILAMHRMMNLHNGHLQRNIKGTYAGIIYPLQDVSSWHTPHDLPPILGKNLPGGPKKKDRIPSRGEGRINIKCGRC